MSSGKHLRGTCIECRKPTSKRCNSHCRACQIAHMREHSLGISVGKMYSYEEAVEIIERMRRPRDAQMYYRAEEVLRAVKTLPPVSCIPWHELIALHEQNRTQVEIRPFVVGPLRELSYTGWLSIGSLLGRGGHSGVHSMYSRWLKLDEPVRADWLARVRARIEELEKQALRGVA